VLVNLTNSLINEGHDVIVISEIEGSMWDILPGEAIKEEIPSLQRSINPVKDLKTVCRLRRLYKKYRPDVIHLHSSKIGMLGRIAFPRNKIVYTVHGFDSIRIANPRLLLLERLFKNRAKYIVGVSQYDLIYLQKENIKDNSSYIYNGIWDSSSEKRIIPPALFTEIISKYSFVILTIARFSVQKKFDLFCEIASLLKDENIAFFWIGNQYIPDRLPENVYCMGSIKNAYRYIPFVDLCILPSNYEGLPIFIIESLLYGKPVVASNVGGISEILDGTNGFAVDNSPDRFVEKIMYYRNDKNAYKAACKHARETYIEKFTIEHMYTKYLSLYKNIISSNK
jgi:glycosyltransferase involved in cell wall biosynthesis